VITEAEVEAQHHCYPRAYTFFTYIVWNKIISLYSSIKGWYIKTFESLFIDLVTKTGLKITHPMRFVLSYFYQ